MPVGRYIRGLNSYDLLGNLLPGIVALVVTLGVFATPPIPSDIGEYALFVVIAFLTGGLIQSIASTVVGRREHFDLTMMSAEERTESALADRGEGSGSSERRDDENKWTIGKGNGWAWKCAHPFIGPLFWWLRPARGEKLDDAILVNRIWEHLIDTHEIPFRTTSYSVLYHVMSSRVDDIQSPSRAVRMQALRNFNRGMWITAWYTSALITVVLIVDWNLDSGDTIPIVNFTYEQPVVFEYVEATWILVPIALVSVLFFWMQAESSEEDYIEYLFADYVVAVASEEEDISFAEDNTLAVTGHLTTELVGLSEQENKLREKASDSQEVSHDDSGETDQSNGKASGTRDAEADLNSDDEMTSSE